MKVSREEKGFQPITIVLETEEEARYMLYALNYGSIFSIRRKMALDGHGAIATNCACDAGQGMFSEYVNAYHRED